jgi:hypothetical protein
VVAVVVEALKMVLAGQALLVKATLEVTVLEPRQITPVGVVGVLAQLVKLNLQQILVKVVLAELVFNRTLTAITISTLAVEVVADLSLAMAVVTVVTAVAVVAQQKLGRAALEALVVMQEPLERLVLLGQTVVLVEQIQVAVVAREIPLTQAQLVTEAQEL